MKGKSGQSEGRRSCMSKGTLSTSQIQRLGGIELKRLLCLGQCLLLYENSTHRRPGHPNMGPTGPITSM